MRLSTKISFLSTIVLVFFSLLFGIIFFNSELKFLQTLTQEQNYFFVQQISWQIDSVFKDVLETLKIIFYFLPPPDGNEEKPLFLTNLFNTPSLLPEEIFDSLIILNREGKAVAVFPSKNEALEVDYSQKILFKEVLNKKDFYISPQKEVSPLNNKPVIALALSLRNELGEAKYVIVAHIKPSCLFSPNFLSSLGKGDKLFIVDNNGEVIFHSEEKLDKENLTLEKISPILAQKIADNEKIILLPPKNPTHLFTVESIKMTNWKVIFQEPLSEIYLPLKTSKNSFIRIIFTLATVASLLISLLVKANLKGLQTLSQEIEMVKKGNLKHRIKITSGDETRIIAEAINKMMSEMEHIYQNLEKIVETRTIDLEKSEEEKTVSLIRQKAISLDAERKAEELEKTRQALMNILEDVDEERRKAEEEKIKTIAIIQSFVDGIIVLDKERKVAFANSQFENFFQVKREEIIGKTVFELKSFPILHPLIDLIGAEIKEISRKEISVAERLVLEVSTVPILLDNEKTGNLIILHDVTREKEIERIKTEFVSISAHQLRTPLSAIKWSLKMILDGDLGPVTEEQREILQKTSFANERLINLVNDLLNVARIEEGRYLFKLNSKDFISLVSSIVENYQEEMKHKEIDLQFEKPDRKIVLMLDEEKISLALQNLIENAIKYTPPKGKITIAISETEKEVIFSVSDTGIGIPKEQQYRVFSKFFRGSNVMRLETEGSGLGLFITKNIIEAHNGRIWFISEEGKGTTFYFTLPKPT